MNAQHLTQPHQSAIAPALTGTWKLGAGHATTLQPGHAGHLRVAHGRIWATFDGPHSGARNNLGDVVLGAGERLLVAAGRRIVIESWQGGAPAYFAWDPVPSLARVPQASQARLAAIAQPLRDLRLALAMAAGATARLAAALAGAALAAVWPRRRPLGAERAGTAVLGA